MPDSPGEVGQRCVADRSGWCGDPDDLFRQLRAIPEGADVLGDLGDVKGLTVCVLLERSVVRFGQLHFLHAHHCSAAVSS